MSNPWDNDPIVTHAPAQKAASSATPWANDPVVVPAQGQKAPPQPHTFLGDVGDAVSGAWNSLKNAPGEIDNATAMHLAKGDMLGALGDQVAAPFKQAGAAAGLAFSPLTGALNYLGDKTYENGARDYHLPGPQETAKNPALKRLDAENLAAFNAYQANKNPQTQAAWEAKRQAFLDAVKRAQGADPGQRDSIRHQTNQIGTAVLSMPFGELAPTKAVSTVHQVSQAAQDAERMNNAGITPFNAIVHPNPVKSTALNVVADNPAGFVTRGRLDKAVSEVHNAADNIASQYGQAHGPRVIGEAVQGDIGKFNDAFSQKASDAYDQAFAPILRSEGERVTQTGSAFDAAHKGLADKVKADSFGARTVPTPEEMASVPSPAPVVTAPETVKTLKDINGRINAPTLNNVINSGPWKSIGSALEKDGGDLRFTDLRNLRTWVREAQKNNDLRQSIGSANLQRLEGALTSDIYANANNLTGDAGEQSLRQADEFYRNGSAHIKDNLQPVANLGSGESVYSRVLDIAKSGRSADVQSLANIKASVSPQTWNDIAANTLSDMGMPRAGNAVPGASGTRSASKFATDYSALSDEGRDLLFGNGALRKKLDDLAFSAGRVMNIEKAANGSKTFSHAQLGAAVVGLGNPLTALPTAAGLSSMAATGEYLTNPVFARIGAAKQAQSNALSGLSFGPALAANSLSHMDQISSLPPLLPKAAASPTPQPAKQRRKNR